MRTPLSVRFDQGADQETFHQSLASALRTSDGTATPNRVKFVEEHDISDLRVMEHRADEAADKGDAEVLQEVELEARDENEQPVVHQTVKTVRFPDAQ